MIKMSHNPVRCFTTSPEIIPLAVMMQVRFRLSLRDLDHFPDERRIDICKETVRHCVDRSATYFAHGISSGPDQPVLRVVPQNCGIGISMSRAMPSRMR